MGSMRTDTDIALNHAAYSGFFPFYIQKVTAPPSKAGPGFDQGPAGGFTSRTFNNPAWGFDELFKIFWKAKSMTWGIDVHYGCSLPANTYPVGPPDHHPMFVTGGSDIGHALGGPMNGKGGPFLLPNSLRPANAASRASSGGTGVGRYMPFAPLCYRGYGALSFTTNTGELVPDDGLPLNYETTSGVGTDGQIAWFAIADNSNPPYGLIHDTTADLYYSSFGMILQLGFGGGTSSIAINGQDPVVPPGWVQRPDIHFHLTVDGTAIDPSVFPIIGTENQGSGPGPDAANHGDITFNIDTFYA